MYQPIMYQRLSNVLTNFQLRRPVSKSREQWQC